MLRIARCEIEGQVVSLASTGGAWVPLGDVDPALKSWRDAHAAGPDRVAGEVDQLAERQGVPWETASSHRVLDPVGDVGKVVGVGLNYRKHAEEDFGGEVPETPLMFAKWRTSVCGPYDPVALPPDPSAEVDYEAELAVVLGDQGRDLTPAGADKVVAGFTVANDLTARDVQRAEAQWTRAKSFDGFCPLGPWLTLAPPSAFQDVPIRSWVNGELRQDGRTSLMVFSVGEILEALSEGTTVEPGDVVLTGTPAGVALGSGGRTPWLAPGDVVECSVEGLGSLRNQIL